MSNNTQNSASAEAKLERELADGSAPAGIVKYIETVKRPVTDALISFCRQSTEFADAIIQSDKNLYDCLAAVVKDAKSSLSDIEAYRRAVAFYFPGAEVYMQLSIRMSEYEDKPGADKNGAGGAINVSLFDLL